MKKRIRKKSEKYIQKCLLLTPGEQKILATLAEKAELSQNEFLRNTIRELSERKTATLQGIAKEIETIKKYLIRQNCPYCKSYDMVSVEGESTIDRDVQLCQACKRRSMYIPQSQYYELVPYDFYTQQNSVPPDTSGEVEQFQYKANERDMEDIKKILVEEKINIKSMVEDLKKKMKEEETLHAEKITCVKCGFQSYFPQKFYRTPDGICCKGCVSSISKFVCGECGITSYFPGDFHISKKFEGYECNNCFQNGDDGNADNKME